MAATTCKEFVEGWLVAQVLGEGAYGEVRLLVHARTGESVALKLIRLRRNGDEAMAEAEVEAGAGAGAGGKTENPVAVAAAREASLHRALKHPHVLRCLGDRCTVDAHYMFLEYAQGGELFDRIEPDVGMSESNARRYWRQILSGIEYLHGRGVAHRDIKPENLLLDANDNIKISDFGMATLFRFEGAERYLARRCGTLPYAAPEVLRAAASPYRAAPADLWSAAVVLLTMLSGELPWEQASPESVTYRSWAGGLARGRPWDKVGARALGLLRRLLHVEPSKRLSLADLQRHPWTVHDTDQPDARLIQERESGARGWCSQPTAAGSAVGSAALESELQQWLSLSQPAAAEDLLLGSPALGSGPGTVLQRLVRRMTRVWVRVDEQAALAALQEAVRALGHTCQLLQPTILAISLGRVGLRAWAVRAAAGAGAARVLLEFRRSRGCGLQFKRAFLELRAALAPIAAEPPSDARLDLLARPIHP